MPSTQPSVSLLSVFITLLTLTGVLANAPHAVRKRDRQPEPPPESPESAKLQVRIPLNIGPPPAFRVYKPSKDFPDPETADKRLRQAWVDMWHMAAVACILLDEQEEVYQRYFEPGESEMVRFVFCNIAGIEDHKTCDLSTQGLNTNPILKDLTIIAGKARPEEVPPEDQPDLEDGEGDELDIFCTTFQNYGEDDDKAFSEYFRLAFDFPSLDEIFTLRTCAGLGPTDSGLMTSLGAHMLHEMVHWRDLVRADNNKERFDAVVVHNIWAPDPDNEGQYEEEEMDIITDYSVKNYKNPPAKPTTGYGPVNTRQLVLNGNHASFQNADNYRWYGVSKYWSWRCTQANGGKKWEFKQQTNEYMDDSMIPKGCNGKIPCP